MRKLTLMLLLVCMVKGVYAQYMLQPVLPASGVLSKSQLWNVLIVSSAGEDQYCKLELVLRDRISGMEQMTAVTGAFLVSKGPKQLSNSVVQPVQYSGLNNYTGNGLSELLPVGSYTGCYRLITAQLKTILLAEACVQLDVEPLSPPQLVYPPDSSRLGVRPSQFSWVPPSPVQLFSQLSYELNIVEVMQGQQAAEAIQQNIPVYTVPNVSAPFQQFKGLESSFEKNKWYAWQVTAKDIKQYAAKSQVYVFRISDSTPVTTHISSVFYKLSATDETVILIDADTIPLRHYSYGQEYEGLLEVRRKSDGRVIKSIKVNVQYGDNYYMLPLRSSFRKDEIYEVVLSDNKSNAYKIQFKIQKKQ